MKRTSKILVVMQVMIVLLLQTTVTYASNKSVATTALTKKSEIIGINETYTIPIKNKNSKAIYTYKSSKTSVAKVSTKGKITGISAGKAKITVVQKLSGKTTTVGTFTVTVENQTDFDIDTVESTYRTGDTVNDNNIPMFYTNKDTVNFTSSENIIKYYVHIMGSWKSYTDILYDDGLSSYSYKMSEKDYEYLFKVNLENGYTKSFKFYYDCTAPVFGFKKNEKITAGCIVDAYDEGSGIKTITLNGEKIPKYYRFKKKGTYTIKVTDYVGNQSSIKVICTSNCPSWASKLPSIYSYKKRAAAIAKKLNIKHYRYGMEKYNGKMILTAVADKKTHKVYDYNGTYLYTEYWDTWN